MAASHSPESGVRLTEAERALLLDLADAAIRAGLSGEPEPALNLDSLSPALRAPTSVFVTLTVAGRLNGCIGNLDGRQPLAIATADCARSAAFSDFRLPSLRRTDYEQLDIEVSVLSTLTPIMAAGREELLPELRPRLDGLLLVTAGRRGVFLPKVWEHLPDPEQFLDQLLVKAGLPRRDWPVDAEVWRFTTESFSRPAGYPAVAPG